MHEICKKSGPAVGTDDPSTGETRESIGLTGCQLNQILERHSCTMRTRASVRAHVCLVFILPRSPPCPPPSSPQLHLSQVPSESAAPFSHRSTLSQVPLLGVPTGFCSFPLNYFLITFSFCLVVFPVSHNSVYFNTAHVSQTLVNKLKLSLNLTFLRKTELVPFLRSLSLFRNAFHPVQNVAFLSKAPRKP